MFKTLLVLACLLLLTSFVFAEDVVVNVNLVNDKGIGKEIGTITASDSKYGLILTPHLSGLAPGLHGFHVHEKPDCSYIMKEGIGSPGACSWRALRPRKDGQTRRALWQRPSW